MAKKVNKAERKEEAQFQQLQSLEVSMLNKDKFTDDELDAYLDKGEIKASDQIEVPPQILWVDDCTIATFGNFSASTGKAKSK